LLIKIVAYQMDKNYKVSLLACCLFYRVLRFTKHPIVSRSPTWPTECWRNRTKQNARNKSPLFKKHLDANFSSQTLVFQKIKFLFVCIIVLGP